MSAIPDKAQIHDEDESSARILEAILASQYATQDGQKLQMPEVAASPNLQPSILQTPLSTQDDGNHDDGTNGDDEVIDDDDVDDDEIIDDDEVDDDEIYDYDEVNDDGIAKMEMLKQLAIDKDDLYSDTHLAYMKKNLFTCAGKILDDD